MNRTNNIFELVTVDPVLTERLNDQHRNEILLSDELDTVEDKSLRLKGTFIVLIKFNFKNLVILIKLKELEYRITN